MTATPACRCAAYVLLIAVAVCIGAIERAYSYAEPSIIPQSWQFDFDFVSPRLISVTAPGDAEPRWYWYLPYTVTNRTGEDRLWVPRFVVYTDHGDVIEAGKGVSPVVYSAIAEERENPLLESPIQVIGRLLQGEDNARDSVAIWPAPTEDVDTMSVFVSGLSGETQAVTDPASGQKVIVRKTLMLNFTTPGAQAHLATKPVRFKSRSWVMR